MMNSNLKQIALNLVLLLLAFSVQTCVFPLLPFLSAYPNLMLRSRSRCMVAMHI